ncbi:MAG: metallophosphoesterase [Candidatus Odinarchaeota archaeon]
MKNLILKPIPGRPALLLAGKERRLLCIADLHLGIETTFIERGINVTPQSEWLAENILSIAEKVNATELLIVGDLKHNIPINTVLEAIHIPEFLNALASNLKVTVIPGNHDTGLKKIIPGNIHLERSTGMIVNLEGVKVGFVHGHSKPCAQIFNTDILITAHTHPAIRLIDRLYKTFIEPVWVTTKLITANLKNLVDDLLLQDNIVNTKTIIMPAFNPLITGSPVNTGKNNPFLGPLQKPQFIDVKNAEIHMLDGTYLGTLKDLPEFNDFKFNFSLKNTARISDF